MKKETLEWDYKMPITNYSNSSQRDWNQTLITIINIGYKMLDLGKKTKLFLPKNFIPLIETIDYFDKKNNRLFSKIPVIIVDRGYDSDEIILFSKKRSVHIKIKNYEY